MKTQKRPSNEIEEEQRIGDYILLDLLDRDEISESYRAEHITTGDDYTIKVVSKEVVAQHPHILDSLNNEITLMYELNHPNILHLYELLETSNFYYQVLDYCNGGYLVHYLKDNPQECLQEAEAVEFLHQIAGGFYELTKQKITHRNLNIYNLLMKNGNVVISGLGFAKRGFSIGDSMLQSAPTMAYEILCPTSAEPIYHPKSDLWSIGAVYHHMLFGCDPFTGDSIDELIDDIERKSNGHMKYPKQISDKSRDLLDMIFRTDADLRLDWDSFFNHPLFYRYQISGQHGEYLEDSKMMANNEKIRYDAQHSSQKALENVHTPSDTKIQSQMSNQGFRKDDNIKTVQMTPNEKYAKDTVLNNNDVKEVFHRYAHEHSKMLFIVLTVKKIQNSLKEKQFYQMSNDLYNACMLLLKKALTMVEINLDHLDKMKNLYNFDHQLFANFLNSPLYSEITNKFIPDTEKLTGYMDLVTKRMELLKIKSQHNHIIASKNTKLVVIDDLIAGLYSNIIKHRTSSEMQDPKHQNNFILMLACIAYCFELDHCFPFVSEPSGKMFNWSEFYVNYELKLVEEFSQHLR